MTWESELCQVTDIHRNGEPDYISLRGSLGNGGGEAGSGSGTLLQGPCWLCSTTPTSAREVL